MTKAQITKAAKNFVKASSVDNVSVTVFVYGVNDMLIAKAIAVSKYGNVWEYRFNRDNTYALTLLNGNVNDYTDYLSCDLNMWKGAN